MSEDDKNDAPILLSFDLFCPKEKWLNVSVTKTPSSFAVVVGDIKKDNNLPPHPSSLVPPPPTPTQSSFLVVGGTKDNLTPHPSSPAPPPPVLNQSSFEVVGGTEDIPPPPPPLLEDIVGDILSSCYSCEVTTTLSPEVVDPMDGKIVCPLCGFFSLCA